MAFILKTPLPAQRGIDIHVVLLWHIRHELQHFACYVDKEWEISDNPATVLAAYPHKDDLDGGEIMAHFMERANLHLIDSQIYTASAVSPDTDFDMSSSPVASPSQEDHLPPTSAKKPNQQGIHLHTEAHCDELLGHSCQSDTLAGRSPVTRDSYLATALNCRAPPERSHSAAKTKREHMRKGKASSTKPPPPTTKAPNNFMYISVLLIAGIVKRSFKANLRYDKFCIFLPHQLSQLDALHYIFHKHPL